MHRSARGRGGGRDCLGIIGREGAHPLNIAVESPLREDQSIA